MDGRHAKLALHDIWGIAAGASGMSLARNPWKDMPIHRIGTYTEHGLTPGLVREFIEEAKEAGCEVILDPFVGSGVVAVEAQKACLDVIGIDANPWSLTLTAAKTTKVNSELVLSEILNLLSDVEGFEPLIPTPRLRRYYEPVMLDALGKIRRLIEYLPENAKALLLATFMKLATKYSNLRRTPAPRFRKRAVSGVLGIHVLLKEFTELLKMHLNDLREHRFCGKVTLFLADSTLWLPERICGVLTSPPFANNIDYVRHTMLELFWSGFARDSNELGALRSIQVPACEACARSWKEEFHDPYLDRLLSSIKGKRARGYRRYLSQYFSAMLNHFKLLEERLAWQAWYTIGDSILGGVHVPVHHILVGALKRNGFKLDIEIKDLGSRAKKGRKLYLIKFSKQ